MCRWLSKRKQTKNSKKCDQLNDDHQLFTRSKLQQYSNILAFALKCSAYLLRFTENRSNIDKKKWPSKNGDKKRQSSKNHPLCWSIVLFRLSGFFYEFWHCVSWKFWIYLARGQRKAMPFNSCKSNGSSSNKR